MTEKEKAEEKQPTPNAVFQIVHTEGRKNARVILKTESGELLVGVIHAEKLSEMIFAPVEIKTEKEVSKVEDQANRRISRKETVRAKFENLKKVGNENSEKALEKKSGKESKNNKK